MKGIEFKKLLKMNGYTQEEAAKIFNVSRPTISVWCHQDEIDDKIVRFIESNFRVKSVNDSAFSANVTIASNNVNSQVDNRHYYSDSPDVLKQHIDLLDERIKEKDAQIKEKDAQIKEKDAQIRILMGIIERSVAGEKRE